MIISVNIDCFLINALGSCFLKCFCSCFVMGFWCYISGFEGCSRRCWLGLVCHAWLGSSFGLVFWMISDLNCIHLFFGRWKPGLLSWYYIFDRGRRRFHLGASSPLWIHVVHFCTRSAASGTSGVDLMVLQVVLASLTARLGYCLAAVVIWLVCSISFVFFGRKLLSQERRFWETSHGRQEDSWRFGA